MSGESLNPTEFGVFKQENPSRLRGHPTIKTAAGVAKKILANRMSLRDFGYRDSKQDSELIERLKKEFDDDEELRGVSDILEAILYLELGDGKWFGEETASMLATEYDDVVNGVDVVVEFLSTERPGMLAIAVDATMSRDAVRTKLQKIKSKIKTDELTKVKYFESGRNGSKSSLENLPHVVIGLDPETILELSQLLVQGDNEKLLSHHARFVVIQEVWEQLEWGLQFATECNSTKAIASYEKLIVAIRPIYEKSRKNTLIASDEHILQRMRHELEQFRIEHSA
jgi:hypothetical protein